MDRHASPPTVHHFARWQRRAIVVVSVLLLASGAAWLALHYTVGAGTGELPHPLEAWLMRMHGLAAFAGLVLLGIVAGVHVPHGWRLSRRHRHAHQRRTGLLLGSLAAWLALSGYLLYYFAPEWLRPGLGWAHAAAGGLMAVGFAVHSRSRQRP